LEILSPEHGLILLDVMMGGMSGYKMAEKLRSENNNIPIVFLTARNAQDDLLTGFSSGADDYITKPFSIQEVIVRVKAVLRRYPQAEPAPEPVQETVVVAGALRIDLEKKIVHAGDQLIAFSKKEYEVLSLLASHPGQIFSREDLINELWKDAPYVLDRTVDVHIARIRSKLGEYKNCISNRSGFGYVFNAVEK
jgi:DNA-binding response OmpR family regulator